MLLGLSPSLRGRIEVVGVAVVVCLLIFELVRRKRLMERYAILWLLAGATVLVLGLWRGLLTRVAHAVGIHYAPSALFAITSLFVLVMLVHFSTTVSRLSDQSRALAQRVALLQARLDATRAGAAPLGAADSRAGAGEAVPGEFAERAGLADRGSGPALGAVPAPADDAPATARPLAAELQGPVAGASR